MNPRTCFPCTVLTLSSLTTNTPMYSNLTLNHRGHYSFILQKTNQPEQSFTVETRQVTFKKAVFSSYVIPNYHSPSNQNPISSIISLALTSRPKASPINRKDAKHSSVIRLVESQTDVALDASSQMDLGLQIKLDANKEGRVLLLAVVVGGSLEQLTCRRRQWGQSQEKRDRSYVPAGEERPVEVGSGRTSCLLPARRPPRAWPSESVSLP